MEVEEGQINSGMPHLDTRISKSPCAIEKITDLVKGGLGYPQLSCNLAEHLEGLASFRCRQLFSSKSMIEQVAEREAMGQKNVGRERHT